MPGLPHPRRSLGGYADGRLPSWRRSLLERHLGRCTPCSLEVARTRALRAWLAAGRTPAPGEDLLARLRAIGGPAPAEEGDAPTPPVPGLVPVAPRRGALGAAGVLVAGAVLVGTAGAGAVVTGLTVPWPGPTAMQVQLSTVLPRLLERSDDPDGADPAPGTDNGRRP